MTSILGSAITSVTGGASSASTAATHLARISSPTPSDPDIATDFVTLTVGGNQVAVGAKLAETAQQDDKTLLDIVA